MAAYRVCTVGIYASFFNMFALYSFGSALEFWEVKVLFFYISCGLGAH
jgi:membrane associated rhomboid family serine protease